MDEENRARTRTGLSTSSTKNGTIEFRIHYAEVNESKDALCIIVDQQQQVVDDVLERISV